MITLDEIKEFNMVDDDQLAELRHSWEKTAEDSWIISGDKTQFNVLVQLDADSFGLYCYFKVDDTWNVNEAIVNDVIEESLCANHEAVIGLKI